MRLEFDFSFGSLTINTVSLKHNKFKLDMLFRWIYKKHEDGGDAYILFILFLKIGFYRTLYIHRK